MLCLGKKLAEVNIQFTEEASKNRGIISIITSALNAADVNIVEIMSAAPELILIVSNNDLINVLNTLNNIKNLY